MIPIQLELKGFLSYQQPAAINFESLHLACISGSNGAGKSSILDAITWVIFGKARSRDETIINQASTTAEVVLKFYYEDQKFQILRSKTRDKPLLLEFFVWDTADDKWRILTEHTTSETQVRIITTLRMDYETFINASFFLQGKADQFTQKTPGERKEILSKILGLEIWESYRDTAREKRRQLEKESNVLEALLKEIQNEITQQDSIQSQILAYQSEIEGKSALKSQQNLILEQARQLELSRSQMESQLKHLRTDLARKQTTYQQHRQRLTELNHQCSELELQIEHAAEIESGYTTWQLLRSTLETWENKASQYFEIQQQISASRQLFQLEENQLQAQIENLEKEEQQNKKLAVEIPLLQREVSDLFTQIEILNQNTQSRDQYQEQLGNLQKEISIKQEEKRQVELRVKEMREHYKDFDKSGPNCPFCNQPLTPEHREKYKALMTGEGLEVAHKVQDLENIIADYQNQVILARKNLEKAIQAEKQAQQIQLQWAQKNTILENKHNLQSNWLEHQAANLAAAKIKLDKKEFSLNEQEKIKILEPQLITLEYNPVDHQVCKQQEAENRIFENKMRQLEKARASLEPLTRQTAELKSEVDRESGEIAEQSNHLTDLQTAYDQQFANQVPIQQLQKQLDLLQIEINQLNTRLGAEQQKLNSLERRKVERVKYQQELDLHQQTIVRYQKLEEAFGKNGVPALLIEQALPEIEEHANQILEQLSGGTMSIRFETQSDYKNKKRQDKKETLEILINDANGYLRSYEMFSGGEAFRINFAIRLALSRVLAKRAGARLQTLVIDEGFGSQDGQGRQRLVQAINLIQADFAKILVITHLDELKDAFPARIEIDKTAQGSQVQVQVL
jgi:exonuclease SbcC